MRDEGRRRGHRRRGAGGLGTFSHRHSSDGFEASANERGGAAETGARRSSRGCRGGVDAVRNHRIWGSGLFCLWEGWSRREKVSERGGKRVLRRRGIGRGGVRRGEREHAAAEFF